MMVPIAFLDRPLRSRICYRNLQNHNFTASEKEWLCSTIIAKPNLSPQQVVHNVTLYCNRYSISRQCVKQWLYFKSLGIKQSPGYCIPDDYLDVDTIGIAAIVNYDADDRQADESAEAHLSRLSTYILRQENATTARRAISLRNQRSRLKVKRD